MNIQLIFQRVNKTQLSYLRRKIFISVEEKNKLRGEKSR